MTVDEIVAKLLKNRDLSTPEEIGEFLHPTLPAEIASPFATSEAIKLIKAHIKKGHKIAVYGDYDVDGICSTAIMWETLYSSYKNVFPHIPHRESEGYGLSTKGIDHCLEQGAKLIIAVDNGIMAHKQIDYCKSKHCDIIVIDHHEPGDLLPQPTVLLHSISACAAGLTWLIARDFTGVANSEQLSLVALATICDLVPLTGLNRSFAKYGLDQLKITTRPGLLALYQIARLKPNDLGAYQVGFVLGPRLNSMGRLEHAIDSLRLLCTKNISQATQLAQVLDSTNRQRQTETEISVTHALGKINKDAIPAILVSVDTSYHQGVIGLIASKMVDTYWRPSIAVSIGEEVSKGSGRSIPGFHLTNYLREFSGLFDSLGGHAMACGFAIKTKRLDDLFQVLGSAQIDPQLLVKSRRVDMEIPLETINFDLLHHIELLQPFGLGNPTPTFQSSQVVLSKSRRVGKNFQHLKCQAGDLDAICFNYAPEISSSPASIVYTLEKDTWNGADKLQLVIKDIHV